MFPHALKRAVRPAESLFCERAQIVWRFSPGDRRFFVTNRVTQPSDSQRQILIFRQSVCRETAGFDQQVLAPCAHSARHNRDAIETRERAPVHILRSDVFECLPARHQVYAVAKLCAAIDRLPCTRNTGCA